MHMQAWIVPLLGHEHVLLLGLHVVVDRVQGELNQLPGVLTLLKVKVNARKQRVLIVTPGLAALIPETQTKNKEPLII